MTRAFLVVIDSVGIGGAPDAGDFFNGDRPDTGANTLAHIAAAGVSLPVMGSLGLWRALALASGVDLGGPEPVGAWGAATEQSRGKDTPSGHWELAGVPVPWDWHTFPDADPAFPDDLVVEVCSGRRDRGDFGQPPFLGDRHSGGGGGPAYADRVADLLYLRRFRVPDCGA
jgi:phosphopentomutase